MTSLAVSRSFECAPHATRSIAMALALCLNLGVLLFALQPSTPYTIHAPPPQSILAAILQPPPAVQFPVVPTVRLAPHVAAPTFHIAIARATHATQIVLPALATASRAVPVQTAGGPTTLAAVGNSDATIAYETATPPAYPIDALRAGIQGTVLLKVLVDPTGKPVSVKIAHSSGSRALDTAARRHVLAAWRFHPALRNGHAIEAWVLVPVRFNLNRD